MSARGSSLLGVLAVAGCAAALVACPASDAVLGEPHELPSICGEDSFRESISLLELPANRDVDILFVIDNSRSMAEEQVRLVESAGVLFEALDALGADYRIGFTTTDSGNPWCPAGVTTPEAGQFVLSPCTERLSDFLYNNGTIDARDLACNELCKVDAAGLTISPTTTNFDSEAAPRLWLERRAGETNFPATTEAAAAFACFAPQGISGCGFESPLESMYLSLVRALDEDEDEYGFLRTSSVLAVVILTDEVDCSLNKDWSEIFDDKGTKVFWSDPNSSVPSSAVCWNAGVSCTGDPSGYDSCEPVDHAANGAETSDPAAAVLHSLSRYRDRLDGLELQKQALVPERDVIVSVIAGGEGSGADWSVSYADAADPQFQLDFGIGPGCVDANGDAALPPVRLRALAEAYAIEDQPASLHSVCAPSYDAAMAELGAQIAAQMPPLCFKKCAADADLSTPQLEPHCVLRQDTVGEDNYEQIPLCERDAAGYYRIDPETGTYQLPADADVCFAMRVDPDGSTTADPNDDMSAACVEDHFNLEFALARGPGVAAPDGTVITVDCELADCPDITCAGIGG